VAEGAASVISEREIYGVAKVYLREHGEDAVIHAAMRADALFEDGNLGGRNVWLRVIEAIKVLTNVERPSRGETH